MFPLRWFLIGVISLLLNKDGRDLQQSWMQSSMGHASEMFRGWFEVMHFKSSSGIQTRSMEAGADRHPEGSLI